MVTKKLTAEEYLENLRSLKRSAEALKLKRRQAMAEYESCRNELSDMPRSLNSQNKIESLMIKLEEYDERYADQMTKLCQLKDEAKKLIGQLANSVHRDILELRYIENTSWQPIADSLHYSRTMIYYHHGIALNSFREIYKD